MKPLFPTFVRGATYLAPLLVFSFLHAGCSPEPTSKAPASQPAKAPLPSSEPVPVNHEPIVRAAKIYPSDVSLLSTLRVDVRGEDPTGRALT